MNFTPRKQPLKEGRSYPGGLPYGGPSGRGIKPKQALLLLVLLCLIPIYLLLNSNNSALSGAPSPPDTRIPPNPAAPKVVPKPVANAQGPEDGSQAPFRAPAAAPARDEEPASHQAQQPQAGKGKGYGGNVAPDEEPAYPGTNADTQPKTPATGTKIKWIERPQFEKALAKVINMLPGEMHMRDLLRPVEGTGKEKLREMGLRTRAYKSYFEAWEDLHLDTDNEGGTYVRDDVVQYMRSHVHEDMISGTGIAGLETMDLAQQIRSYENYRYFLAKFGQMLFPWTAPYFSDHMSLHAHFKRGGRGIVLTAGDDQAPYLLTSIPMMRELGCNLPIEVMYLGDSDLSEDFRSDLEAMDGVITRDIAQMVNDEGWRLAGWAGKPFAILFSSFREVIFIDADSLFFKNPEVLFDDPGYQKTGALFFKDRMIMPENKKRMLQQILPKPISKQVKQSRFWTGDSGHMQESGVVVVDKWRHFMAMLMVTRMNGPDRDGNKEQGRVGVYDLVYGDKETFWLGWELVGDPHYVFHGGDAGIMGDLNKDSKTNKEREKEEQQKGEEYERKKEERRKQREEQQQQKAKEEEEKKKRDEEADAKKREENSAENPPPPPPADEAPKPPPATEGDSPNPEKSLRKRADEPHAPDHHHDDDHKPDPLYPSPSPEDHDNNPPHDPSDPDDQPPSDPVPGPSPDTPSSYTLCSPQLLHLSLDGTPLWFNGWLLDNKFADKHKKKFGTFVHYLIEPREVREPGAWQLHENNECCLTTDADKMRVFSKQERGVLERMMKRAREVGAPGG